MTPLRVLFSNCPPTYPIGVIFPQIGATKVTKVGGGSFSLFLGWSSGVQPIHAISHTKLMGGHWPSPQKKMPPHKIPLPSARHLEERRVMRRLNHCGEVMHYMACQLLLMVQAGQKRHFWGPISTTRSTQLVLHGSPWVYTYSQ